MITATVVVTNYNYAGYVGEAVLSALSQTAVPVQVIVVDDGSTDGSPSVLKEFGQRIEVISKENGGQLSCLNAAMPRIRGDIVFFLDADDYWDLGYLEDVLSLYEAGPERDFVFCGYREVGAGKNLRRYYSADVDMGLTAALSYFAHQFVGSPTSALSCRAALLRKILPYPFEEDWRICADNCLVLGASVVCGNKYYRDTDLVRYRIHEHNNYAGKPWCSFAEDHRRLVATYRFVQHVAQAHGIEPAALVEGLGREMKSGRKPRQTLRSYWSVLRRLPSPSVLAAWRVLRANLLPLPPP